MKGDTFCVGEAVQYRKPHTKAWRNYRVMEVFGGGNFLKLEREDGESAWALAWEERVKKHGEGRLGPGKRAAEAAEDGS